MFPTMWWSNYFCSPKSHDPIPEDPWFESLCKDHRDDEVLPWHSSHHARDSSLLHIWSSQSLINICQSGKYIDHEPQTLILWRIMILQELNKCSLKKLIDSSVAWQLIILGGCLNIKVFLCTNISIPTIYSKLQNTPWSDEFWKDFFIRFTHFLITSYVNYIS